MVRLLEDRREVHQPAITTIIPRSIERRAVSGLISAAKDQKQDTYDKLVRHDWCQPEGLWEFQSHVQNKAFKLPASYPSWSGRCERSAHRSKTTLLWWLWRTVRPSNQCMQWRKEKRVQELKSTFYTFQPRVLLISTHSWILHGIRIIRNWNSNYSLLKILVVYQKSLYEFMKLYMKSCCWRSEVAPLSRTSQITHIRTSLHTSISCTTLSSRSSLLPLILQRLKPHGDSKLWAAPSWSDRSFYARFYLIFTHLQSSSSSHPPLFLAWSFKPKRF